MAIDKATQVSASCILEKEVYEKFKYQCKEEKRSISSQIAYLIDEYLKDK